MCRCCVAISYIFNLLTTFFMLKLSQSNRDDFYNVYLLKFQVECKRILINKRSESKVKKCLLVDENFFPSKSILSLLVEFTEASTIRKCLCLKENLLSVYHRQEAWRIWRKFTIVSWAKKHSVNMSKFFFVFFASFDVSFCLALLLSTFLKVAYAMILCDVIEGDLYAVAYDSMLN